MFGPAVRAVSLVEERARAVAERYAVNEIRIPMIERLGLFERSSGETSDLVEKQMYLVRRHADFEGADEMALRPEGTPSVVRAYIEAGLDRSDPEQRFFYSGPMLRYERPQKGRYRQFHQFGVEIFGRADAEIDAELLLMLDDLRRELGVELEFQINSLGCEKCRPSFRESLLAWGRVHYSSLCEDCHRRLERNPLRVLDCKTDAGMTESAPRTLDYLCDECRKHFNTVQFLLDNAHVQYVVNPRLVRGLDYYTRTTFEVVSNELGSQNTVAAGGRYDGLVEQLGGAAVAGAGFAIGVERLALAVPAEKIGSGAPDAVVIALGEKALPIAMNLAHSLRSQGFRVEVASPDRGLKALLRRANRVNANYALIMGDNEIERDAVMARRMSDGVQIEARFDRVAAILGGAGSS
jgi:histidyl-tRNA synthetase